MLYRVTLGFKVQGFPKNGGTFLGDPHSKKLWRISSFEMGSSSISGKYQIRTHIELRV